MRFSPLLLSAGMLLVVGCAPSKVPMREERTIAEIEELGGTVEVDDRTADRPVVKVDLNGTKLTDAGLARPEGTGPTQGVGIAERRRHGHYRRGSGGSKEGFAELPGTALSGKPS